MYTTTVHKYDVSIQSSTKVRETFRQITQKLSVGHKDLRLGQNLSNVFQKLLAKIHTSTKVFQDFLTLIFEALKLIISRLSIDDNKSTSWLTPFNYF